jgi:hypothetical protein
VVALDLLMSQSFKLDIIRLRRWRALGIVNLEIGRWMGRTWL